MAATKKRVSGGDEPPRDLPLSDEDLTPEEQSEADDVMVAHLRQAEGERDAALEALSIAEERIKALESANRRLEEECEELRGQLGEASLPAYARSPASQPAARSAAPDVADGKPVQVQVTAKKAFVRGADLVPPVDVAGGTVAKRAGEVFTVRDRSVVLAARGALRVL